MKRLPFLDRFWARVHVTEAGCWEWTGARLPPKHGAVSGYGVLGSGRKNANGSPVNLYAHRVAWELATHEEILDGKYVCHRCDNPACVRFEHLFLGTASDNIVDMYAKGRGRRAGARPLVDLKGQRFGTRVVTKLIGYDSDGYAWSARCECGAEGVFSRPQLNGLCVCTPWPNERMVTVNGVTKSLSDWARGLGISRQAVDLRIRNGWTVARACTTPRTPGMGQTPQEWRRYRRLRKRAERAQQQEAA